ncbi:flippase-like domain-containing protein [Myxococcota bacterium]|nr:flippase-like domain-containing protein [Myxococcota bacterium]MBU1899255.1 flippase-like domain-containing protein [Myxococcota bacterium]
MSFLYKYILSIALGALLVWLAFRGEDWGAIARGFEAVDLSLVGAYLALYGFAHFIRILRWGVLVRALGPIRWRDVISIGAVGYLCIITFPLRLGELVRPYLVRGKGVSASGTLATVVVERVIDGLLFVALFFTFLSTLPHSGKPLVEVVRLSAYIAGAIFSSAVIILLAAYARRAQTTALLRRVGVRINARLTDKIMGLLEAFLDGLKVLPNRKLILLFLAFTVFYWFSLGWGMQIMASAVGIHDLSLNGAFALLAVVVVGIMVPAGPGFAGTFEVAMKAGFSLLVLSAESEALIPVYIITLHVLQVLIQVSFGAIFFLTGDIRIVDLFEGERRGAQP